MSDILGIEDSAVLLDPICRSTSIPLWALIRTTFIRQILSMLIYNDVPFGYASKNTSKTVIGRTLVRSIAHNALQRNLQGDVCFMTSSLGMIVRNGRNFDRLSGYFAEAAANRSFFWEDQYEWRWLSRRSFERVVFHAPLQVAGALIGRLRVSEAEQLRARDLIEVVAQRCRDLLDVHIEDGARRALAFSLARRVAATPFLFDAYSRQLRRRGVRLLFKEDACYSSSAIVLAAAHAQGIETAEFQHGAISSAHDAYNFAPTVAAHTRFRATLPRHFLGYGDWWNRQINLPIHKIVVGNPHRDESLSSRALPVRRGDILLVLGDGVETERYFDFMRKISSVARASGLRPVFRPHPMERPRLAGIADDPDFEVDTRADIYEAISDAAVVVSEISTGLFEAIGLVDHILIWNTSKAVFNFPEHPFQSVDSADDLVEVLQAGNLRHIRQDVVDGIWAPSWRTNYLNFLDLTVGKSLKAQR